MAFTLGNSGGEGKTSMLQDIEAHRKTEVDSFAGELIRRAEKHDISVPVNETLFGIIKVKELTGA
nr:ketopantoate reductase C-terminal domain-containing protein [Oceanispirochaeta crateris]